MRLSFWVGNGHSWDRTLATCSHAERCGFDGLWIADHLMPFTGDIDGPTHESWSMLAALAAAVPRVRLGPLVSGNTYRNPAMLAKVATTVDHISGGRVVLGLGAGWQENEHTAYGFTYGDRRSRSDRLEQSCEIVRGLLDLDRTTVNTEHYDIVDAPFQPKPVQTRLPILIGGKGEQRTLRTTARWADEWNGWLTPDEMSSKNAVLDRRCEEADRDPSEIARSAVALWFVSTDEAWLSRFRGKDLGRPTIVGTPAEVVDVVGRYGEAGCDELIVPDMTLGDESRTTETLSLLAEHVLPATR